MLSAHITLKYYSSYSFHLIFIKLGIYDHWANVLLSAFGKDMLLLLLQILIENKTKLIFSILITCFIRNLFGLNIKLYSCYACQGQTSVYTYNYIVLLFHINSLKVLSPYIFYPILVELGMHNHWYNVIRILICVWIRYLTPGSPGGALKMLIRLIFKMLLLQILS